VIERLVDTIAHELDVAPDVLRRRKFIKPKAMPYTTPTGKIYDSGDFAKHLARAQEMTDWPGFKKRAAASRKQGKLRGMGVSTYIEACGNMGPETATVDLDKDGGVTVLIGSQSTGQGHATAYAQLVADRLGLPPDRVRMVQGDTDKVATGGGTGGSSSIPCGGASLEKAVTKLATEIKKLAADALEASSSDLEIEAGTVRVAGTDRMVSFAELAAKAKEKVSAADVWTPEQPTYPNGTHVAEVEIDEATGEVDIVNYVVVDDFGMTLNPLMLEGQVHGGAVQGIGQALMENTAYDASTGQLIGASLMDYALPRASDSPSFAFETANVPCKTNPLGVKGAGEAGAIGSCPAVINAILDALWRNYRIREIDMPATPQKIWAAIEAARA
jgi:carbon-monoxide dehydrogenase large subunit